MNKRYKNSFIQQIVDFVASFNGEVILRADLNALGEYRQVSRAIKALIEDGKLVKLGYGIYAKASTNEYIKKPIIRIGFDDACLQALNRFKFVLLKKCGHTPWIEKEARDIFFETLEEELLRKVWMRVFT